MEANTDTLLSILSNLDIIQVMPMCAVSKTFRYVIEKLAYPRRVFKHIVLSTQAGIMKYYFRTRAQSHKTNVYLPQGFGSKVFIASLCCMGILNIITTNDEVKLFKNTFKYCGLSKHAYKFHKDSKTIDKDPLVITVNTSSKKFPGHSTCITITYINGITNPQFNRLIKLYHTPNNHLNVIETDDIHSNIVQYLKNGNKILSLINLDSIALQKCKLLTKTTHGAFNKMGPKRYCVIWFCNDTKLLKQPRMNVNVIACMSYDLKILEKYYYEQQTILLVPARKGN